MAAFMLLLSIAFTFGFILGIAVENSKVFHAPKDRTLEELKKQRNKETKTRQPLQ